MALRYIVSPAKKMLVSDDFPCSGEPRFLDRAEELVAELRSLDAGRLQALWKTSDALTERALADLEAWRPAGPLATPAVMSYSGIQYQKLAASVLEQGPLDYLQGHLRILSGLYGVLRPFDGVEPYRLEMQAKLSVDGARDLYGYWGSSLADALVGELEATGDRERCIVNLASKEYAKAVLPHVNDRVRVVTCLFGERRQGRLIQRATQAKAARGMFVRWCAEKGVTRAVSLASFKEAGYFLDEQLSTPDELVFTL